MVIRGAPAIGVAAAMGIALGMRKSRAQGTKQFAIELNKFAELMAGTRPTAVNLFWAIDRMKRALGAGVEAGESVEQLKDRLEREAHAIHDEDLASCRAIGRWGARSCPLRRASSLIATRAPSPPRATARRSASSAPRPSRARWFRCSPTRRGPFCRAPDSPPGSSSVTACPPRSSRRAWPGRYARRPDRFIVVGADRIAANGDFANKVGTYTVAMMAQAHGVPFYVAAPLSTIDLNTPDGDAIPIEQRNAREMTHVGSLQIAPSGASIWNPAFDVTPHRLVAGIITERGIVRPPYAEGLRRLFESAQVVA